MAGAPLHQSTRLLQVSEPSRPAPACQVFSACSWPLTLTCLCRTWSWQIPGMSSWGYCQQGGPCALQCAWQPCLGPSYCVIVAHTTRTPAQLNGLDAVWCSPPRWPICAFAAMQRTIVDGMMLGS